MWKGSEKGEIKREKEKEVWMMGGRKVQKRKGHISERRRRAPRKDPRRRRRNSDRGGEAHEGRECQSL